jgi:type I restriction enzyme M protein
LKKCEFLKIDCYICSSKNDVLKNKRLFMDALIEDNITFSNTENTAPVLARREEVQQPSIEAVVAIGGQLLLRCFNMIRNIERLQSDAAFDEVCKLLLIIVLQDKGKISQFKIDALDTENDVQSLFDRAKSQNVYSIFEEYDRINITVPTFKQVLWELSHFDWANDDSRTLVFEDFLTGVSRNSRELITTPQPIIDYMVDILAPQEGDRICDPCCGNGGFLIKSYEYIKNTMGKSAKINLLAHNIYGVDINEKATRNFKIRLFMHNIEGANLYRADGLFDVDDVIENKFDVIFAEPPISPKSGHVDLIDNKSYAFQYRKIDIIFVERCLNLLKEGGRMGLVLIERVLESEEFEKIRYYIESQAKIIKITSLPDSAFSLVKTTIIFFQKFTMEEKNVFDSSCELARIRINKKYETQFNKLESVIKSKNVHKSLKSETRREINLLSDKIEREIRSELPNYSILFADVKDVGITSRGYNPTNNELISLVKDYKYTLHNIEIGNQTLLKRADYNKLKNWSVRYLRNIEIARNEKYHYSKLANLLVKNAAFISIEDSEEYNRVTVKLNNNGVVLRDTVIGEDIGTKRQFRISKGQLIISKIGIFDGAIGIVPNELDNAIVTSDFSTYTVKADVILPEYLELLLSSDKFKTYFSELGSGSVIRRLNEDLFLNISIPVPTLAEQNDLCQKAVQIKKRIKQLEQALINEKNLFKNTLFES